MSDRRQPSAFYLSGFRRGVMGSHHGKMDQVSKVVPARVLSRGEVGKIGNAHERFICEEGYARFERDLVKRM